MLQQQWSILHTVSSSWLADLPGTQENTAYGTGLCQIHPSIDTHAGHPRASLRHTLLACLLTFDPFSAALDLTNFTSNSDCPVDSGARRDDRICRWLTPPAGESRCASSQLRLLPHRRASPTKSARTTCGMRASVSQPAASLRPCEWQRLLRTTLFVLLEG